MTYVSTVYAETGPQLISDEEIEDTLIEWLSKFYKVAGVSLQPKVFLVKTHEINAGATFGGLILVYTGLIMKCKKASHLLGVLAHETGHIAGGHMAKSSAALNEASVPALASLILGGAAAIATGNPAAILAGVAGGAHVLERSLLRHSRAQEDAADASAITYLTALKLPVAGLAEFHDLLGQHYATGKEDPYVQTHPLPMDRKEKIQLYQQQQKVIYSVPEADEMKFKRMRAKLFGYLKTKLDVQREYPLSDHSIPAQYARLINEYVNSKSSNKAQKALEKLDNLLQQSPNDPYLIEMQGQFMFEAGRPQESLTYFRQALNARPNAQNIRIMYAQALIETVTDENSHHENLTLAISALTQVLEQKPENTMVWRLLGTAYGKQGKANDAAACLAEEAILMGNVDLAKMQAKRGKEATNISLKKRAEDILQHIKNANG